MISGAENEALGMLESVLCDDGFSFWTVKVHDDQVYIQKEPCSSDLSPRRAAA